MAGAWTTYTVNFTTDALGSGIPADGKIKIKFPPGFDVDGVDIATFDNPSTYGGFDSVSGNARVVTLERDGTGSAIGAGEAVKVTFSISNLFISYTVKFFRKWTNSFC